MLHVYLILRLFLPTHSSGTPTRFWKLPYLHGYLIPTGLFHTYIPYLCHYLKVNLTLNITIYTVCHPLYLPITSLQSSYLGPPREPLNIGYMTLWLTRGSRVQILAGPNFEALEVTIIYFTFSETSNFFPFGQGMSEKAVTAKNDL